MLDKSIEKFLNFFKNLLQKFFTTAFWKRVGLGKSFSAFIFIFTMIAAWVGDSAITAICNVLHFLVNAAVTYVWIMAGFTFLHVSGYLPKVLAYIKSTVKKLLEYYLKK